MIYSLCHSIIGIRSEKWVIRQFHCCVNIIQYTYTNEDGKAYYTPMLYCIKPITPKLQAYTACYHTKHKIKSTTRENDAIKRPNKPETQEAIASVTRHTVLQKNVFVSRKSTFYNNDKKYNK